MNKSLQYATDVVNGKIVTNKYIRIICQNFISELKNKNSKYYYDKKTMEKILAIISEMRHIKGDKAGEKIILEPWQEFFISNIYCWKNKETGMRKYKFVFLFTGKGNGKTILAAIMATLDTLFTRGGEALIVTSRKEQSLICFDNVRYFIQNSPVLKEYLTFYRGAIVNESIASNIKAHSGRPDGLNGKNLSLAILDEIAEIKNFEVFQNVLSSSSKRSNTIVASFTTAQSGTDSIGYSEYQKAKKIVEGVIKDDTYFPVLYQLDEEDDWKNPDTWIKANPNLNISIMKSELERKLKAAKSGISADEIQLRTHNLNQFIFDHTESWITADRWKSAESNWDKYKEYLTEDLLRTYLCCGSLDLSVRGDLSVYTLVFYIPQIKKFYFKHQVYVPQEEVSNKMKSDSYMFFEWIKQGKIIAIPGHIIDKQYIIKDIIADSKKYKIKEFAYDRYGVDDETLDTLSKHLNMLLMRQNTETLSQPTSNFYDLALTESLIDNSEIAKWCISNVEIQRNNYGIKVVKEYTSSNKRVDVVITSIMALARLKYYQRTGNSNLFQGIGNIKY